MAWYGTEWFGMALNGMVGYINLWYMELDASNPIMNLSTEIATLKDLQMPIRKFDSTTLDVGRLMGD